MSNANNKRKVVMNVESTNREVDERNNEDR